MGDSNKEICMPKNTEWMRTFTGKKFWPLQPRIEDLDIRDIAHHLGMQVRYNGAVRKFYSVAEHSVIVSQYVPTQYAREGLLHDAAEAYLGDMIRPLKHSKDPKIAGVLKMYLAAEDQLTRLIEARYNLFPTWGVVNDVDTRIVTDESFQLLEHPEEFADAGEALGVELECFAPPVAEEFFLCRFYELFTEEIKP